MKIRFFILSLALSLSGCSLIYSYSDNLPQRINKWIAEKKYSTALNTINFIQPDHKNYRVIQQKKKLILSKIIPYENNAIEKSTKLTQQGNWLLAFKLLDEVADNIVDTKKIDSHRNKLLKKRNKIITTYENEILDSQAQDLLNKLAIYKKINKTVSESEYNELDISEFNKLRQETSIKLAVRSERQYNNKQYEDALTTIELALRLKPNSGIVYDLNDIKKRIHKKTKLKKLSYVKKVKTLLRKLSQGYSHAILKETKETIAWLNKIKGNEKVYLKLIVKLKKHLTAGVKQNFEAARKLYSNGKTQEALSIWIDLKKLDPTHPKLDAYIKRAKKIISKLKKLSNKPKK